jgi:hypothetical protein
MGELNCYINAMCTFNLTKANTQMLTHQTLHVAFTLANVIKHFSHKRYDTCSFMSSNIISAFNEKNMTFVTTSH